jgi:PiT family inorganic phosphate transporter
MGAGLGKRLASVRWGVAGQMATAWVFTIPAAGVMGAIAWECARLFGSHSSGGAIVMALIAAAAAAVLFTLAQRTNVTAADLDRTHVSPEADAHGALAAAPA